MTCLIGLVISAIILIIILIVIETVLSTLGIADPRLITLLRLLAGLLILLMAISCLLGQPIGPTFRIGWLMTRAPCV